jgi:hypothetical protein
LYGGDPIISATKAAELLGLSTPTIWRWIKQKKILLKNNRITISSISPFLLESSLKPGTITTPRPTANSTEPGSWNCRAPGNNESKQTEPTANHNAPRQDPHNTTPGSAIHRQQIASNNKTTIDDLIEDL